MVIIVEFTLFMFFCTWQLILLSEKDFFFGEVVIGLIQEVVEVE